jgi:hypothetical protein
MKLVDNIRITVAPYSVIPQSTIFILKTVDTCKIKEMRLCLYEVNNNINIFVETTDFRFYFIIIYNYFPWAGRIIFGENA